MSAIKNFYFDEINEGFNDNFVDDSDSEYPSWVREMYAHKQLESIEPEEVPIFLDEEAQGLTPCPECDFLDKEELEKRNADMFYRKEDNTSFPFVS